MEPNTDKTIATTKNILDGKTQTYISFKRHKALQDQQITTKEKTNFD